MKTTGRNTGHCGIHRLATAIVSVIAFAGPIEAHQQWLSPNTVFASGDSAWISFDHTFGDKRFQPSSGPGSYYVWWIVGPDGVRRNVPSLFVGKTRTVGEVELTEAGTYRLEGVEDNMLWTRLELDGEATWQPGSRVDFDGFEIERSTVFFNKSVSYVSLESASDSVLASTGDPLEILFDDHPNELTTARAFTVRVLASREPLVDHEVRLFSEGSEGHDASKTCTTDASGACRFEIASAGRYLLTSSAEGTKPDDAKIDGFRHSYSVFIEVKTASASNSN